MRVHDTVFIQNLLHGWVREVQMQLKLLGCTHIWSSAAQRREGKQAWANAGCCSAEIACQIPKTFFSHGYMLCLQSCRGYAPRYTAEQTSKLRQVLFGGRQILHDCFGRLEDSRTGEDVISWMLQVTSFLVQYKSAFEYCRVVDVVRL